MVLEQEWLLELEEEFWLEEELNEENNWLFKNNFCDFFCLYSKIK